MGEVDHKAHDLLQKQAEWRKPIILVILHRHEYDTSQRCRWTATIPPMLSCQVVRVVERIVGGGALRGAAAADGGGGGGVPAGVLCARAAG
jgi:hypothetical protein